MNAHDQDNAQLDQGILAEGVAAIERVRAHRKKAVARSRARKKKRQAKTGAYQGVTLDGVLAMHGITYDPPERRHIWRAYTNQATRMAS